MTGVKALAFIIRPPGFSEVDLDVEDIQAMLGAISPDVSLHTYHDKSVSTVTILKLNKQEYIFQIKP